MGKSSVNDLEINYRKLFESLPEMYLILTADFIIVEANNDYLNNNNTTRNHIIGKSFFPILNELFPDLNEHTIQSITASLNRVSKNKSDDHIIIEHSYKSKNEQSKKYWDITNYPILNDNQEVIHIIHKLKLIKTDNELKQNDTDIFNNFYNSESESLIEEAETSQEIKILLVDDREDNLFALKEVLSRDGYSFRQAASGTEALKILLNEFDFRLIIMDVQMPIVNGIETASLIYEREKLRHIPIIFITAAEHSESMLFQGYETGGVDYIYKPINSNLLRAKVSVFVELFKKNHLLLAHERRLRKATELLKSKNALLADSNAELEAFTYSISHDLRAPLRAINGYSNILLQDYSNKLNEDGIKSLNQITSNAKKMSHLIDDLLYLSKVSRKELQKHNVNIDSLINTILFELSNHTAGRNLEFKIKSIQPAMADKNLIKQVWINLISNAIKYTQLKEKAIIEIGSKSKENETVYYIKDNGIGFDMEYVDKVFAVFQRLHPAKDFEGTGVGLAIVKRIIQKHGGEIWVNSKVNIGTTFYFTLPNK